MTEQWSNKHYGFDYSFTEKEVKAGKLRLDPYFVYGAWGLHQVDTYGILFHCFKTISRFGQKNTPEREIRALYAQIKRLAELEGIDLEEKK